MTVAQDPAGDALLTSRIFPHSLQALIGSLCAAGFAIRRFAEDAGGDAAAPIGSDKRLSAFVPPFIRLLARKTPRRRRPARRDTRGAGNGRANRGAAGTGTG
jgi:hypothetical protein